MVRRAKQQANRSMASAMEHASKLHEPAQFRVAAPLSLDRMIVSDAVDVDSDAEDEPTGAGASGAGAVSKIEFLEQQLEELRALMEAQAFGGGAATASSAAPMDAASDTAVPASPEAAGCPPSVTGHMSPGAASHTSAATHGRASMDTSSPGAPSQGVLERAGIFVPAGRPSMVDLVAKATATVQLRSVASASGVAGGSDSGSGSAAPRTPVRRFGGGGAAHDTASSGVGVGGATTAPADNNMTALLRSAMQQRFGRAGAARNTRGCMSGELSPMSDATGMSDDSGSDAGTIGNGAVNASSPLPAAPMLRGLAGSRRTSFGRRSSSGGKHDEGRRSSSSRRRSGIRKSLAGVGHNIPDVIHEVRPASRSSSAANGSRYQLAGSDDAEESKSPAAEDEPDRPALPAASAADAGSAASWRAGRGRRGMHPAAAAIAAASAVAADGGSSSTSSSTSPRASSSGAGAVADAEAGSPVPLGGTRPRQPFLGAITQFNKGSLRHRDEAVADEDTQTSPAAPATAARRGPPAGLLGAIRQQKGRPEAKATAPAAGDSAAASRPVPSRAAPSFAAALQQAAAEAEKRRAGAGAAATPRSALGSTTAGNERSDERAPRKATPMSLLDSIKGFKNGGLRKTGGPAKAGAGASAGSDGSSSARASPRPEARAAPPMGLGAMIQGVKLRKTGRKL